MGYSYVNQRFYDFYFQLWNIIIPAFELLLYIFLFSMSYIYLAGALKSKVIINISPETSLLF